MTGTPISVRATARVGAVPAEPTAPPTLTPRRRPGYLGPVHIVQLMVVEAIVLVILILVDHGPLLAILIGAVLGVTIVAATLGRRQGRWWLERRAMSWQFRRRNAAKPVRPLADRRLAAMQFLAPGLSVDDVEAPDGSNVGVGVDDAGWYATAAINAGPAMYDDGRPSLPLERLVSVLSDPEQSGRAVVQLVTHTVPVPESNGMAGESYQALLRHHGDIPVDRAVWLTVRLDARALAEMGAEQPEQAPAMVASLLRNLVKSLRRSGVTAHALDRDGLLAALARSCDLALPEEMPLANPHEDWDAWYSGRLVHRSFWLQDWPPLAQAGRLLDSFANVPAALTSVAIVLAPEADNVDIRCLARVAASPNRSAAAAAALTTRANAAGAKLLVLNGEQGPAAYATAPTGGGPR